MRRGWGGEVMAGEDQRGGREKGDAEERGLETEMAEDGEEEEKTRERAKEKIERCGREIRGANEERKLLVVQLNHKTFMFIGTHGPRV